MSLTSDGIPEQVYLDAAMASTRAIFDEGSDPVMGAYADIMLEGRDFRAAVESAYHAGHAAAPDGLSALEQDVIEKAKDWRAARASPSWVAGSDPEFHLFVAVDALVEAKTLAAQRNQAPGEDKQVGHPK